MRKMIGILLVALLMIGIGNSVLGLTITVKCTRQLLYPAKDVLVELHGSAKIGDYKNIPYHKMGTTNEKGVCIFHNLPEFTKVTIYASSASNPFIESYFAKSTLYNVVTDKYIRLNDGFPSYNKIKKADPKSVGATPVLINSR